MLNRLMRTLSGRSITKGIVYAVLSYIIWGILPLFWKALKQIDAGEILASRIVWSFVFLLLILIIVGGLRNLQQVFLNGRTLLGVFLGSLLISANWFIYICAVLVTHITGKQKFPIRYLIYHNMEVLANRQNMLYDSLKPLA